jgi:dihydrofolate synthase / folylpolyglutamate synthase
MNSTASPSEYAQITDYLFALKPRGTKFGIDRMKRLAEALGHPERGLPVIHVAGTNGKGSVAAMLEAILHAAGWRTGLYTSPHLVQLGERVQVDRQILTEAEIGAYVRELRPMAARIAVAHPDDQPSFFEMLTAMAFLQFGRKHCNIAVLEVGLGGQLDATNIVMPEVSVITSIAIDHSELLGDTLEKIAAAKAGIIKPGRPVVIGRMPAEAEAVIRKIAAKNESCVFSVAEEFGDEMERYPSTNLEGDYQQWNAATATLAARTLSPRWKITEPAIAQGLQRVDWAGRWQRVEVGGRLTILDASHNPEGAQVLASNLSRLVVKTGRRPIVITGILGIARARPLLEVICRFAQEVHLVVPNQPRACSHAELAEFVPANFAGRVVASTVAELFPSADTCTPGGRDDVVVVTGSIYLLGEVMTRLSATIPAVPRVF